MSAPEQMPEQHHLDRINRHDDILTELRITVARIEERTRVMDYKLDQAVVVREHLEERLAPLTENMNRWKGALTIVTIVAGAVGATITTVLKRLVGFDG